MFEVLFFRSEIFIYDKLSITIQRRGWNLKWRNKKKEIKEWIRNKEMQRSVVFDDLIFDIWSEMSGENRQNIYKI